MDLETLAARPRSISSLRCDKAIVLVGLAVIVFSAALVVRTYMPCPFWDEWGVVKQIGGGAGPHSWSWLWSQQNEHRIVIPRLFIWCDLFLAGGKNVSLLAETFLLQLVHLAAICWIIERYTNFSISLKRALQGLFAFALFHPNQLENFTWAFQVSFILPFVIATLAIIAVLYFRSKVAAFAPILAAMNLAGGLLIGPIIISLALVKRFSTRYILWLTLTFAASAAAYLYGYHRSATDLTPHEQLSHVKDLFVYMLTYFGASWTRIFPHKERVIAFLSWIIFGAILRRWREFSDFEWFLFAECVLMLATAFLTAYGRIQFGVGQAFASRYETPAMMYWAALAALLLIRANRRIALAQGILLVVMLVSISTFPRVWSAATARATVLQAACRNVMGPNPDLQQARKLYENPQTVMEARTLLLRVWTRSEALANTASKP